jgi:hypothetical protein
MARNWTVEEDEWLRENYPILGKLACVENKIRGWEY